MYLDTWIGQRRRNIIAERQKGREHERQLEKYRRLQLKKKAGKEVFDEASDDEEADIEPPTSQPPTSQPPTSEPPTSQPPTSKPPTSQPPTSQLLTSQSPTNSLEDIPESITTSCEGKRSYLMTRGKYQKVDETKKDCYRKNLSNNSKFILLVN